MTSEEIVKALRCTATVQTGDEPCASCPFNRVEALTEEQKAQLHCEEWQSCDVDGVALAAADLIEQLRREIEWKDSVIDCAQKKRAEAEAERDALLEYAKLFTGCDTCKRRNYCKSDSECNACEQDVKGNCYCKDCERGSKWEWQGLAEAPEGEKT